MKKVIVVALGAGIGFAAGRTLRLWSQDKQVRSVIGMLRSRELEIQMLHRHVNDMISAPSKEEIDNAVSWLLGVVQGSHQNDDL